MHASLVCRLDVLETWGNCLQGTQKVPIHDMRLWPCMAQFRMDLWECRADGRVIECPTQKASAWDLNQHQSLSLGWKIETCAFQLKVPACRISSNEPGAVYIVQSFTLLLQSHLCLHVFILNIACLLETWDCPPQLSTAIYAWNISCLDLPPGEKRMYSQGIKSHQFCCFQSVTLGWSFPGGSHQFSLFHAKSGIEIILNIIHLLYFFCLFLAEPVVIRIVKKSLCFLFRQVETGRFTVGSVGIHGPWHTWPPPPITHPLRCSLLAMPWITSCLFHMRKAYPETYCEPCPVNHAPLLVEMLAAGLVDCHWTAARLFPHCCQTAAKLLL